MLGKIRELLMGQRAPQSEAAAEGTPAHPPSSNNSLVWPEEALASLPWSLHGVRLGATREAVDGLLRDALVKPTKLCWVWGENDMNSVLFIGDRVSEIWATSLERDGTTVLRQGDPRESLEVLGAPSRTFGFMASTECHLLFDMPGVVLDVTVTTDAAIGSREHEEIFGSPEVVDRVFHIGLKLQM